MMDINECIYPFQFWNPFKMFTGGPVLFECLWSIPHDCIYISMLEYSIVCASLNPTIWNEHKFSRRHGTLSSILSLSVCCRVHPYDVNTVCFFHCMILWHCVLWWVVILLADEWPYIFLCWLSCFPVSKGQRTSWSYHHERNGRTLCGNLDGSTSALSLWFTH